MTVITDPKTGIIVAAPYKSDQWVDVKKCRRWLTFFMSRVVSQISCASLPESPVEGQVVVMASTDSTYPNHIARYSTDLLAWEYMAPWDGLQIKDSSGGDWTYLNSIWNYSTVVIPNWVSSHPRTPPASPNAWDDEFNNSSSLSEWTWYKQGASTATFVNGGLLITASLNDANDPNYDYSMLMRDVPSGDWEITSYVDNISSNESTSASCAIGTRNIAAGKCAMMGLVLGASYNIVSVFGYYTNSPHDFPYAKRVQVNVRSSGGIYLRIAKSSGNLIYSISVDGHSFDVIYTIAIGSDFSFVTPDKFVIGCYSWSETNNGKMWIDFVRRTA